MMKTVFSKRFWEISSAAFLALFLTLPAAFCQDDSQQGEAAPAAAAEAAPAPDAEAAPTPDAAAPEAEAAPTPDASAPEADQAESLADVEITNDDVTVEPVSPAKTFQWGGSIVFATVIGIFLVSWLLAVFFAKAWRMHDYKGRYFIVLFCFLLALFSTVYGLLGKRMNLGIDLRGGSILVYGVSQKLSDDATEKEIAEAEGKAIDTQTMDDLKRVLAERINQGGVREIQIQELGGNEEIMVTIPEADEAEVSRIERKINEAGQLKFRILASSQVPEEKELIDTARRPDLAGLHEIRLPSPIGKGNIILGGTWTPVDPVMVEDLNSMPGVVVREAPVQPAAEKGKEPVKAYEALVLDLTELYDVYGKHMARVNKSVGSRGEPELQFEMNRDGATRMKHLTDRYKKGAERTHGRQLGIVLNDTLYSAPSINDRIESRGVITFGNNLSEDSIRRINRDVDDLLKVMKSGVLPAQLTDQPVTRMLTGPTLGEDTIKRGESAILWGGLLVLAFMIAYYGFGGMIAAFAVLMNLLLIMMVMLSLRAAFTLDGLAGLVLTVGMAVDANVLIFERIKDELAGGATLKMAIQNGFSRAFTAIFDSNITTMLTAVILYGVGSEQVKGFAITLFLGVLFSMFTATFVSRVIFETAERKGWIGKRCVYPIVPGLKPFAKTNIPFMNYRKGFVTLSLVLIAVGLVALLARGKGIFDIDFVGGVQIQALFNEPKQISDIRSGLKELPDLSVSKLSLKADRNGNSVADNCCFSISTSCPPNMESEEYRGQVEKMLGDAFGDSLVCSSFGVDNFRVEDIPVAGSIDGKTKKAVCADVNVEPAQAREVIEGYFNDALSAENNQEGIKLTASSTDEADAASEKVHNAWKVTFETENTENANFENEDLVKKLAEQVTGDVNGRPVFESSQTIGSSVAGYARMQGVLALLGSLICIIVYIGVRFKKLVFGFSATVALLHDVLIVLGALAISKWLAPFLGFAGVSEFKIGLPTVAALLTLIGYSLNDTIVLFDRMREICGKNVIVNENIVNKSVNQCLSRTILTSLTTLFVALVLYFFGGAGIHTFAFAISLGVVVGTYSSLFIAAPVLLWLLKIDSKK